MMRRFHTIRGPLNFASHPRATRSADQKQNIWKWPALIAALLISAGASGAREQTEIKLDATAQIKEAAASAFHTYSDNVEVRLSDRRLVLPDCAEGFKVSFPFNDRATAQVDCAAAEWRGFIQIRLLQTAVAFIYTASLEKGEILNRSHAARRPVASENSNGYRVSILEEVLGNTLQTSVQAGDILLRNHFENTVQKEQIAPTTLKKGAWVAREIIPRGNRLSKDLFEWVMFDGRLPSDLIHEEVEFPTLEALRNILPGDKLRRSIVKMAPAVRKDQQIQVTIVRGPLTVTNLVRVSRDATVGQVVDVVNVESGRVLRARVTAIGEVEIM